jgi:hypothetical protein
LIQNATRCLKTAHSIHSYLLRRTNSPSDGPPVFPAGAVDISPAVQSALQHLTYAEFDLLCVLKDDPYPALLIQSRNKDDREWMIRAPQIPKVRAQVLTRLCIGAAEHAAAAAVALQVETSKISKELLDYCDGLRRASRAKACRFQALDEDSAGSVGKGIAWLRAATYELGLGDGDKVGKEGSSSSGLTKLKASWNEKREDKRIEKASRNWGLDGGKLEEGRIAEYLEQRMKKENDTINIQLIPEWKPLLNLLPSGMNMPIDDKWNPPLLEEAELAAMRAPPDYDDRRDTAASSDEDGGDDDEYASPREPVGAFPGTQRQYNPSGTIYY